MFLDALGGLLRVHCTPTLSQGWCIWRCACCIFHLASPVLLRDNTVLLRVLSLRMTSTGRDVPWNKTWLTRTQGYIQNELLRTNGQFNRHFTRNINSSSVIIHAQILSSIEKVGSCAEIWLCVARGRLKNIGNANLDRILGKSEGQNFRSTERTLYYWNDDKRNKFHRSASWRRDNELIAVNMILTTAIKMNDYVYSGMDNMTDETPMMSCIGDHPH